MGLGMAGLWSGSWVELTTELLQGFWTSGST